MFISIEISRPIQWKPGLYKSAYVKRVWWLFFAIAYHPIREDELVQLANDNIIGWDYNAH